MSHELYAAIRVNLPDDARELADRISTITQAWAVMLAAIEATQPEATLAINQTRARSVGASKRGSRRPRLATVTANHEPPGAA